MKKHITSIKKNSREEIRVGLDEYVRDGTTHQMVSARVFFDDGAEMRPGKNGLNLAVKHLPALNAALRQAEAEAQAVGLLGDELADDLGLDTPADNRPRVPAGADPANQAPLGPGR